LQLTSPYTLAIYDINERSQSHMHCIAPPGKILKTL